MSNLLIGVLHGPNLNLLGTREPELYGSTTLDDINRRLTELAAQNNATIECFQSNIEGELINCVQAYGGRTRGIIINPGGYTHTSVALMDAISAVKVPTIEVHLTNIAAREEFRQKSLVARACVGTIAGFGSNSYELALSALFNLLERST